MASSSSLIPDFDATDPIPSSRPVVSAILTRVRQASSPEEAGAVYESMSSILNDAKETSPEILAWWTKQLKRLPALDGELSFDVDVLLTAELHPVLAHCLAAPVPSFWLEEYGGYYFTGSKTYRKNRATRTSGHYLDDEVRRELAERAAARSVDDSDSFALIDETEPLEQTGQDARPAEGGGDGATPALTATADPDESFPTVVTKVDEKTARLGGHADGQRIPIVSVEALPIVDGRLALDGRVFVPQSAVPFPVDVLTPDVRLSVFRGAFPGYLLDPLYDTKKRPLWGGEPDEWEDVPAGGAKESVLPHSRARRSPSPSAAPQPQGSRQDPATASRMAREARDRARLSAAAAASIRAGSAGPPVAPRPAPALQRSASAPGHPGGGAPPRPAAPLSVDPAALLALAASLAPSAGGGHSSATLERPAWLVDQLENLQPEVDQHSTPETETRAERLQYFRLARHLPKSNPRSTFASVTRFVELLRLRIDLVTAIKFVCGEFVSAVEVRDALPSTVFAEIRDGKEEEAFDRIAQAKKQQSHRPLTEYLELDDALHQLFRLDEAIYGEHAAGWISYRSFLRDLALHASYGVAFVVLYDHSFRTELSSTPRLVHSLLDASYSDPVFLRTQAHYASRRSAAGAAFADSIVDPVFSPKPSSKPSSTGTTKKSKEPCRRYNLNGKQENHIPQCCQFVHKCAHCGAGGAKAHPSTTQLASPPRQLEPDLLLVEEGEPGPAPIPSSPTPADSLHDVGDPSAHPPPSHLAGVGVAPRIQRRFHFPPPRDDPPLTPLVSSTVSLSAAPLPRASFSPGRLATIERTIAAFPEEFDFRPTIDTALFRSALEAHPNRRFIESVLRCLERDGFEPPHNGDEPAGNDPSSARFPSSVAHRILIEESVDAAIGLQWTSPGTFFPLPGVTYNSLFVVEPDQHRTRVVGNHTASGLNDGIAHEDCPCVYDTVQDLARIIRWHHSATGRLRSTSILWKLDISLAFKLLVMSRRWQARQGIVILVSDGAGGWKKRYHVEWRGVFGSRAMPFLWTRFMSLLLWISRRRCALENPLAYMDDQFQLDPLGSLVDFVGPDGAALRIPASQAAVSSLWTSLGIPHKVSALKAPFGRAVLIVGFLVDLDKLSISISAASIDKLLAAIDDFLAEPDRCPPLRAWRQLTGWASWALNVAPQARPFLTPMYRKIAGKTRSDDGVPINKPVREALTALRAVVAANPSLDLLSPSLSRWLLQDADVVIYTDACLQCDDGTGAGLDFWTRTPDGRLHHFFSRPPRTYRRIQFAEALAAVKALVILTAPAFGPYRRVLVRTDSSAVVYALDSGAADDGEFLPLRTLTLRAYLVAQSRRFDLKVQHVRGKDNSLADDLSRLPPLDAVARGAGAMSGDGAGGGRRVRFAPSPLVALGAPAAPVQPAAVHAYRDVLVEAALEPRTRRAYARAVRQWTAFALAARVDWVPTADSLADFVAWRFLTVTTVAQTLSGLANTFEPLLGLAAWKEIRDSRLVKQTIVGGTKLRRSAPRLAVPLPFSVADFVLRSALSDPRRSFDAVLFFAMLALGFGTCARGAEIAVPASKKDRNPKKVLKRSTVDIESDSVVVFLPYSKADRTYQGGYLTFVDNALSSAWSASFRRYLRLRDARFPLRGSDDFLFLRRDGSPPTRPWFVSMLKSTFGSQYTGHSLRAGGATHLVLSGWPPEDVRRHGRWRSETWDHYIRISPAVAVAVARQR
ncbi:hypothetical protein JCM8097_001603 [Rhodosporidiobolus ruineniae]